MLGNDKKNETRIVAAYCRVSTDRQAEEGFGLDVQQEKIGAYLKLFDIDNVEWFIDDGYSAKNMNRPQFKKLIKKVEEGVISEIYIYKLDRLSRSVVDVYKLFNMLISNDCSLVSVMDKIDISTANGRMLVGMLSIIAQWERETISERVCASSQEIASHGLYPYGKVPFGYSVSDKVLSIKQDEYNVLRKLGEYIIKYNSLKIAVTKINDDNMINRKFYYKTCSDYLNNIFYKGHLKTKSKIFYNHHIPVWTDKEYDEIKSAIRRRPIKKEIINNYIFRNKIFCSHCKVICKQTVTNKSNGIKYLYYKCPNRCGSVNENVIEYEIKIRIISDFGNVSKSMLIKQVEKLKRLNKSKENLYKDYLTGRIKEDSLENLKHIVNKDIEAINMFIERELGNAVQGYNKASKKEKEIILREIYSKIYYDLRDKKVVSIEMCE